MNYQVNDHYWRRYLRFIESRKPFEGGYAEMHHIYPRSLFPQLANDPKNLIQLTAREHFIAHWILHKAFGGKMTMAFMYMKAGADDRYWNLNSKAYETLRVEFGAVWSKAKTGKKLSAEHRAAMSAGRSGKPLSENHRKSIGAGNTGRVVSQETRQKISEAKKGVTPNRPMTESYLALLRRPKAKAECPHCGKEVAVNMFGRWHGDNCKMKEAFA